jgi:hypothetical protein
VIDARIRRECLEWARVFGLEAGGVEAAVAAYVRVIGERAGVEPPPEDVVEALARLRASLERDGPDTPAADARGAALEALVGRLSRSLEHAEVLEEAGLSAAVPGLRARLEAGLTLARMLQSALRGRTAAP